MYIYVYSMVYMNFEFINAWDHGRNVDIGIMINDDGVCNNPNESGSLDDAKKNESSSNIMDINSDNNIITTKTNPSYWLNTNENCAVNTLNVSEFIISKSVQFQPAYQGSWCILYNIEITVPNNYNSILIEAPIVALNNELNQYYWTDIDNSGDIFPFTIDNNKGGYTYNSYPLVISSNDTRYAFAIYNNELSYIKNGYKITNNLGYQPNLNQTTLISVPLYYTNVTKGQIISINNALYFGSLWDVEMGMGFCG